MSRRSISTMGLILLLVSAGGVAQAQPQEDQAKQIAELKQMVSRLENRVQVLTDAMVKLAAALESPGDDAPAAHRQQIAQEARIQQRMIAMAKQLAEMRAHVAESEQGKQQAQARLAASENERQQLRAENQALRQTVRIQQVKMVEQQETIARLEARVAILENRDPPRPPRQRAARIQATITDLKSVGDTQLTEIDAGASKGVQKGMQLVIYRGQKFVGYLVIQAVTEKSAAGTIRQKQLDPQIGDKVTNAVED
ncbi:MAG: hypothetical protein ACLFUJ_00955 [Phycisphaerae bacterium]